MTSASLLSRLYTFNAKAAIHGMRRARWLARRPSLINRYLATHAVRKLQIGAGFHRIPGWLDSDIQPRYPTTIYLDITESFPLPSASFDYVLSEHIIEHVPYPGATNAALECFRILRPGGRIRFATPDLKQLLGLFTQSQDAIQQRYSDWIVRNFVPHAVDSSPCFVVNNAFRNWGHEFLYDEVTLRDLLSRAGFTEIVRQSPGESDVAEFKGVDYHSECIADADMNRFETMIFEATKPG